MIPLFRGHGGRLAIGLGALVVVDVVQLVAPRLTGSAVDAIAESQPVTAMVVGLLGITLAVAVLRWAWRITFGRISRAIRHDLRQQLYERLLGLGPQARGRLTSGDLIARASADIDAVGMAVGFGVLAAADAVVMVTLVATQIPAVGSWTAAWALLPLGVMALWVAYAGMIIHRRFEASQASLAAMTEEARELLAAGRYVTGSGRVEALLGGFDSANAKQRQDALSLAVINAWFDPVILAMPVLAQGVILWTAGHAVIAGDMPLGNLIALTAYIALLTWPMLAIGWSINLLQRGAVAARRIGEVLDEPDEMPCPEQPTPMPTATTISTRGLTLELAGHQVLRGIDLELQPGELVGLVGPSGSGKSSLLRCLARLQPVPSDQLFYGDVAAERLDPFVVRERLAMAAQEPVLFAESIHTNIALSNPELDRDAVRAAAAAAGIDRELADTPDGYDTLLGERGLTLSGGQRSRVGLARALASSASTLLIDDCLAAVDGDRAAEIVAGLRAAIGERSAVIIAHRLATVAGCDRIVVLDQGQIIEHGSQAELLAAGGHYAQTWHLQHGDPDTEPAS